MTPRIEIPDAAERRRIRTSLNESLIVEASAGTGKTSELVRRIVNVLAAGTRVQQIVAVTFTHKAAGELKIRLRQGLDEARETAVDAERDHLEHALAHLEEAAIGTIHSFCAQILRERPVEACVDPEFGELTELESARLFDRAFDRWFQARLDAPSPGLRRALARLSWPEGWETGAPMDQLKYAGRKLLEWRDFPAAWERKPFEREVFLEALAERALELAGLARKARRRNDALATALRPVIDMTERIARAKTRDYDTLEALLLKLERDLKKDTHKGSGIFAEGFTRESVLEARESLLHSLDLFRQCAGADLAAELRGEMSDLIERYMGLKAQAGKLDFLDLLLMVRDLVRGNGEVRAWLQQRFQRTFIDEFQDTDPLQAEILVLLAADDPAETDWTRVRPAPGKLFVVGDPKQSIYKFRRADVALYQKISEALESRGVARVTLTTSYRSVRPIQEFVNAAFEPEMTGDAASAQSRYSPLEEHAPAYDAQPAVIALPAPRPYGSRRVAKASIDKCLPDATAAFVEWMVKHSGWTIRDPEHGEERIRLEARHICILFRRFTNWGTDVTRGYVRALEARGIPHLLVGSRSFHRREEVETLRAALTAIEWPEDELSVFATLKGTLFAIPDDVLLRFRHAVGPLHPFRALPDSLDRELQPVAEGLAVLRDLHRSRNRRPMAETVNLLLESARAHAGFALRPAGAQVLANVYRVCDLARAFETGGGISFRGFVEELARQADRSDSAEAPVLEEASDGVRLMTVHTAKGLEFPVVILADMTANLAPAEADRYLDTDRDLCATRLLRCAPWELLDHEAQEREREKAEGVRVAYVAATRARDLIVVPVVGDEERDGWLAPLNKAVYPVPRDCRNAAKAPGCPPFRGDATVLDRPTEYSTHSEDVSVKPGLQRARAGGHGVVWWDPASLRLSVTENFGLHQEDILAAEPAELAAESVRRYRVWGTDRDRTLVTGARPRLRILTPSDTSEPPPFNVEIRVESVTRAEGRPAGRLFGVLVHAILRDAGFDAAAPGRIAALARLHGRLLRAGPDETASASHAVTAALAHPVFDRARRASRLHRELPLSARVEDDVLLEGVADLAFLEDGAWTVVDFKTDAWLAAAQTGYERQLRWYAYALSRLTGVPASGLLLRV
ncbi:MAG: UvrD-helicase domain-containing protein [Acidobacteriota bacterium]|nr:UvrD-helicase domain-containing protein [Acidobacteriota bacterium]